MNDDEKKIWHEKLRQDNLEKLSKLNCFHQLQRQQKEATLSTESIYTLTVLKHFTLVTTPLPQFADVLRNVADVSFTDHATAKRYFVIFDSLFSKSKLSEKLKDYPIQTYSEYTIPLENKVSIHVHKSKIKKINAKKNYIEDSFFHTYALKVKLTKKPKVYFFLEETLEEFVLPCKKFKDLNSFYKNVIIPRTCIYQSGIVFQTYFTRAIFPAAFFTELTPARFKNSCLLSVNAGTTYQYDPHSRTYTYQIDAEILKESAAPAFAKNKHVAIPIRIFKNAFAPDALGNFKIGLPFLMTVLFGYKGGRHPLIQLKVSNWIKYGNLSLRRGKKSLCDSFNAKCKYLQNIGLVSTFDPMTLEALKYDKVLKVRLTPISYL